jgi:hypothetical protein
MHTYRILLRCIVLASLLAAAGCGKLEGEFGFKAPFDDGFRKTEKIPEIKSGEKREWVFGFKALSEAHDIGVFILKKEVVWAEVTHYMQKVGPGNNVVYGAIENLAEGRYKIVLVKKKELIAEKEFLIYSDEETQ